MNTVYCWFDWEDNTTTVNNINIIQEPRKPWTEYSIGERVLAKLPRYGKWHGVIVEISESKKDLEQNMNARQTASGSVLSHATNSGSELQNSKKRKAASDDGYEVDSESENDDDDDKGGKKATKKVPVVTKKRTSQETSNEEEKRKKKLEDALKVEAKNKQLEDIILKRRQKVVGEEKEEVQSTESCAKPNDPPIQTVNLQQPSDVPPTPGTQTVNVQQQSYVPPTPGTQTVNVQQPSNVPPTPGTSCEGFRPEYQPLQYYASQYNASPYSAIPYRYSYVGDLMSAQHPHTSTTPDLHKLASQKDIHERCDYLQQQNETLLKKNEDLKKENEKLRMQLQDSLHGHSDDIVTPKKVEVLRQIVSAFENKTPSSKRTVIRPTPMRLFSSQTTPSRLGDEEEDTKEVADQEDVSMHRTWHWEESVLSSGVRKVRLVPDLEVFISQAQLSEIQHCGGSNPKKMITALLDILFTKEQLARSSARGTKKAHNAKLDTIKLPPTAVLAIKQFVLMQFKRQDGTPCLEESVFNDKINSKCATARRALNK